MARLMQQLLQARVPDDIAEVRDRASHVAPLDRRAEDGPGRLEGGLVESGLPVSWAGRFRLDAKIATDKWDSVCQA